VASQSGLPLCQIRKRTHSIMLNYSKCKVRHLLEFARLNKMKCPECGEVMLAYERDGRIWYDCPRCGFDFCDDDNYTHEDDDN